MELAATVSTKTLCLELDSILKNTQVFYEIAHRFRLI